MKAFYDKKPKKLEKSGNSYLYRWDIIPFSDEEISGWKCKEIKVSGTLTKDKLLEKAILSTCCQSRESKLINDYNSVKLGLFDNNATYKQTCINRYLFFLSEKQRLKKIVESDCKDLNIY